MMRIEARILLKPLPLHYHRYHMARDGYAGCEARRFDPYEDHGMRICILPYLDSEILDTAILIDKLRKDTRERADEILPPYMRLEVIRAVLEKVYLVLRYTVIREIIGIHGIGAHDDIAIDRRGHMYAHVGIARHGIERHRQEVSHCLVQHEIASLAPDDTVASDTEHRGNSPCSGSG